MKNFHPRQHSRTTLLAAHLIFVAVSCSQTLLAQEDTLLGTWALEVTASTYHGIEAPRSVARIYKEHPDGIEVTIVAMDAAGEETMASFVADYDGVAHPVSGFPNADAVILEQENSQITHVSFLRDGQVTETADEIISDTGIEMKINTRKGDELISEELFQKVIE
jgi:hypothetical protein